MIHWLYLIAVWLHILAATVWVGGMFFLVLVVVPWLRHASRADAGAFWTATGTRFRVIGWTCFAISLSTGTFVLYLRGVRFSDFAIAGWRSSPFGQTVILKLSVFAAVLIISIVHDFVVGPRAARALALAATTGITDVAATTRLRRQASWLGRINALLALTLVALAVMLVRGRPW